MPHVLALQTLNANTPLYNTLMGVTAGLALLMLVALSALVLLGGRVHRRAWAMAFVAVGAILTFMSAAMVVSWPLVAPVSFDNIIFGEPGLAFGVMLLVGAYLLGSRRLWPADGDGAAETTATPEFTEHLEGLLLPLSGFSFALGLVQFSIAAAGLKFQLFAAPPTEPISGNFSDSPLIEASFISGLYVLTGIGAVLFPLALLVRRVARKTALSLWGVIGVCWTVAGVVFLIFSALNYYTHIGDIVNENKKADVSAAQQVTDPLAGFPAHSVAPVRAAAFGSIPVND
jgi:uncharacterized membrane protein